MEMHQNLVRPGTLVAFDVAEGRIADLTAADPTVTACLWRRIATIEKGCRPSWRLAERLIAAGAEGARVPSIQNRSGINLVLWRWNDGVGDGACLTLLDPERALTHPQ